MFTGIVTDIGHVRSVDRQGDTRLVLESALARDGLPRGASVACSGVCLTVAESGPGWFAVDVSAQTLAHSTLGDWRPGTAVNLERSLRLGDELGGHLVFGHVDAVAEIAERAEVGGSLRLILSAPAELAPFLVPRGSVALDGVSLTVTEVADDPAGRAVRFGINVIPHTAQVTTLGAWRPGRRVNLEIDMLARYVERQLAKD